MDGTTKAHVQTILDFLCEETIPLAKLPNVDVLFVFGSSMRQTAEHAASVWHRAKARHIVVSGKGCESSLPGGYETEANFFSSIMQEKAVPREVIIIEGSATNTLENVLFGMKAAEKAGVLVRSAILCGLAPHTKRMRATFKKQFPDVETVGSGAYLPAQFFQSPDMLNKLVGELTRLRKYARQGDIAPVEIPTAVENAANTLRHILTRRITPN